MQDQLALSCRPLKQRLFKAPHWPPRAGDAPHYYFMGITSDAGPSPYYLRVTLCGGGSV